MIKKLKNSPFVWNSFIVFAGGMVVNVLNYIFHLIAGRMVTIEMYGEIESLISFSHLIAIPATVLGLIAVKYSAHSKAENDVGGSLRILEYLEKKIVRYGLPLFILAVLFTPLIKNFLKIDSVWPIFLTWCLMLLGFLLSIRNGVLSGWQKFEATNWSSILGTVTKLIFVVIFLKLGWGVGGVMGSFLVGSLVMIFFSNRFLSFIKKSSRSAEKLDFAPIKKYLVPATLGTVAGTIFSNADMFLAKHNLSDIASGEYGALSVSSKAIFFATGAIATVLFSMSAEENHKKGNSLATLKKALALNLLITFFATAFYFFFPEFVLKVFFGHKYVYTAAYLGWFAIAASLFSFSNILVQYLLSIHAERAIFGFFALSIIQVFLIFIFGRSLYGIIESVISAQSVAIIWGAYFAFKEKIWKN